MHTFFINDLIQLLRHVSNNQVFILRKTCTCSFMVFFIILYYIKLCIYKLYYILIIISA